MHQNQEPPWPCPCSGVPFATCPASAAHVPAAYQRIERRLKLNGQSKKLEVLLDGTFAGAAVSGILCLSQATYEVSGLKTTNE